MMLMKGNLSEILVIIDPKLYPKYVTTPKQGVLILGVELTKYLYVIIHYTQQYVVLQKIERSFGRN